METIKQIKAQTLVNVCQSVFSESLDKLEAIKERFCAGKIPACKARKEYQQIIIRVSFYNKIQFAIAKKYTDVYCRRNITDFAEYINFFEY